MENSQYLSRCAADTIRLAARTLFEGNLVAFPTETVYGLGADATNANAIAKIYRAKGRPTDHPLIVHVHSMQGIEPWVSDIPDYAISLARVFWPGPMTLILNRSTIAKDFVTGGQDSIGVRVPSHPIALSLLHEFHKLGGRGVAAPSANRFGHVSPTTSQAVYSELNEYLEDSDLVIDGGPSNVGLESTIINCTGDLPRILRPGAITISMIREATGLNLFVADDSLGKIAEYPEIRASGLLKSHYAPEAIVLLDQSPLPGEGFIAMSCVATPDGVVRLAAPETHEDFARVLYSALRDADNLKLRYVFVVQPKGDGIAVAIRDRLQRASNSV